MDTASFAELGHVCAPMVAPSTLVSLAYAESSLDSLTIGVNGRRGRALHPTSPPDAIRIATALLAEGKDFDLGLTQINVRNLHRLGMSVSDAFDPCRNLAGGARILSENYLAASRAGADRQAALRVALSVYNTGDPSRGLRNGYVSRVYRAAQEIVPAIMGEDRGGLPATSPARLQAVSAAPAAPRLVPSSLDPFSRADPSVLVWPRRAAEAPPPPRNPFR